jgi:hypothetical protein
MQNPNNQVVSRSQQHLLILSTVIADLDSDLVMHGSKKCRCQHLTIIIEHTHSRIGHCMLEPGILGTLSTVHLLFAFCVHVSFHVSNVIVLRNVAVFLHVRTLVLRHGSDKVFNDLVRNERMPQIKLSDIWLYDVSV